MKQSLRFVLAIFAVVPALHGCYSYVPVDTAAGAPVGERLAFDITDQGRAALADRLGPGVLQVEGSLREFDANSYVMSVWGLSQIGTGLVRWSGENVRISRDFVGGVRKRQLSRSRTFLTVGGITVGVFLFARSQSLVGGGRDDEEQPPPVEPESAIIWSWK